MVNEKFFLKGHKRSIEKRIEHNDPALVALSDLILTDDPDGHQLENNVAQAVRRLVESGHIVDTDSEKNQTSARLRRAARTLEVDVLCPEIETSKFAPTDAGEVDAAIEIFRRLNSGGMNLSAGDVAAAQLAQETTRSILGPMRDFAKDRACVDLGLNFVFLTRALAAIRRGTARISKLPKHWAAFSPPVEESWGEARKGLGAATHLVRRMGWSSRRWLPSANALIPVARFAALKGGRISSDDEREVARFLCLAAWAGAFSGASETAIDHYLRRLKKAGPRCSARVLSRAIPKTRRRRVRPSDILNQSKMTGALMQIYLAYLVSQRGRSFPSGVSLADAAMKRDGMGSLQVHHVFPRKYVERIEGDLDVNTMANYVILTGEDNESLGDEDPKVAYEGLSVENKRNAREQFIPFGDPDALLADAYEAFTKRRAQDIASALNKFMGL